MSLANLAHLHLLLNHFPTVGFSVGLGLYLIALIRKSDDLKRAGLVIFLGIALLTIPTYMTGRAAESAIEGQEGLSEMLIETHQDAALLAFLFMTATGVLSWLGLWQYRRVSRIAGWNTAAVLLISLITFGLMARAANIGGEIRHPEIQAAGDATAANTELVKVSSIAGFVNTTNWAWPTAESLQFIGLVMLMGTVLIVNLRMLGVAKNISFAAVHRLLPWGVLGFVLNVLTGIVFFVTVPDQYTQNIALEYKMALTMIAGANVLYFTVFDEAWAIEAGGDAPARGKFMAGLTILLWIGIIWLGRMMPFIGGSF
jgi:uncharacterized membrane protein